MSYPWQARFLLARMDSVEYSLGVRDVVSIIGTWRWRRRLPKANLKSMRELNAMEEKKFFRAESCEKLSLLSNRLVYLRHVVHGRKKLP